MAQELEGVDLGGEWTRIGSNNPSYDGVRMTIRDRQAVITHVPESALRTWAVGDVVWRDIRSDGSFRVLGSDDQYYPAFLSFDEEGNLGVAVRHSGAGNVQTWARHEGCWPSAYMRAYGTRTPGMWVRYSTALPQGLQDALLGARDAQAAIQTVALTPSGEWVVIAANRPCYSAGFPEAPREWIDRYIASGREIDVVAFGPGGRWLIVAEDYVRRTTNVSESILEAVRAVQARGERVTSFAFSDKPDTDWVLTGGGGLRALTSRAFDQTIRAAMSAANSGRRPIHEVAIAPGGEWVLVAEDWFASSGIPWSLRVQLERYRTEAERRIDHVVLHPDGERLLWAIVSNTPEPEPAAGDLINLVEHGLPGDSTIYQRMRVHGVTGLSVALIQNNQIAWARGYGLREFDLPESYVYPQTTFDAASISKPVTYAATLQLVDSGDLSLIQTGILSRLVGDSDMPTASDLDDINSDQISLAHLLSHCAGIDNEKGRSGAQSMGLGTVSMPTYRQMIRGESPAASGNQIVDVDSVSPGTVVDYSGANSLLVQALVEDAAPDGFDAHMRQFLQSMDMRRSTFATDFWQTMRRESFARGHSTDTTRTTTTKRDITIYPNQAAAGLRATASDLARFVIMLNQGGVYDGERILQSATVDRFLGRDGVGGTGVREATCSDRNSMQLGIRANQQTRSDEMFWHGGLHNGYRTFMYGMPQQQTGLVLLLTGALRTGGSQFPDTEALRFEIKDAVANAYGWSF
ncbi:MAG: serine hydrolase domain-containing protein [Bacteroidota bacterium]